jgi:acetylornithine deacetylase/succinyl-diaminopimelate desuccinylase-like protein
MVENKDCNAEATAAYVEKWWADWYVKGLCEFIEIPNLSPMFDAEFYTNGTTQAAAKHVDDYINKLEIKGITKHSFTPEGKPPMYVYVVEANGNDKNVMCYGHLDKQPWMMPWREGLGPTKAVIEGDFLYGRGGADDGYAPFSCALAIKNLQVQGLPHPRFALVLETEEESGSPNLLELLALSKEAIGTPDIMFCMDSGAFNWDQLWMTSSLRGIICLDVQIDCAHGGYHSGEVGGIVPETMRIMRHLLDRIDDSKTGMCCEALNCEIPERFKTEAKFMAELSGPEMYKKYHVCEGVDCMHEEGIDQMYLNNTWRANMAITGAAGLPAIQTAGNVCRPSTSMRLSIRLPPKVNPDDAYAAVTKLLTTDVPYNAKVICTSQGKGQGWCMGELSPWLTEGIMKAGA